VITGDQSTKAFHLLAEHNCYNCKYCNDMMLTEYEVNDFTCLKECKFYKLDDSGVCEYWESE